MTLKEQVLQLGKQARTASHALSQLTSDQKNAILLAMADSLEADAKTILSANALDLTAGREKGLSSSMLDRLTLDETRLAAIADGIRQVASLPDPVGEVLDR